MPGERDEKNKVPLMRRLVTIEIELHAVKNWRTSNTFSRGWLCYIGFFIQLTRVKNYVIILLRQNTKWSKTAIHHIAFVSLIEIWTVLDLGGGGSFSTIKVRTPFSNLADMAEALEFSGNLNFLISFWGALLSNLRYLQPSSSPSSLFLFPLLRMTKVFSSSTVTCANN